MFTAYLWKEWREYRRLLITLAVLIPIVHVIGWTFLHPARMWAGRGPLAVLIPSLLTIIIAICAIAVDIVTKEKNRSGLCFLLRLPGDAKQPFMAKIFILTLVMMLFWLVGPLTILLVDTDLSDIQVTVSEQLVLICIFFLLAIALGYWGVAVSSWLPNGSMALPTTFLVVGAAILPYLAMWTPIWVVQSLRGNFRELSGYIRPLPGMSELVILLLIFLPVASVAGAWISFSAFKRGGRSLRSALFGFPFFVLCILTFTVWGTIRQKAWSAPNLHSRDFYFGNVVIGKGGNYAFLNVHQRNINHALIYNLRTKEWYESKRPYGGFASLVNNHTDGPYLSYPSFLRSYSLCPKYIVQTHGTKAVELWSGETGKQVSDNDISSIEGFESGSLENAGLKFFHQIHGSPTNDDWAALRENRVELKKTGAAIFVNEKYWLVRINEGTSRLNEYRPYKWMLYHVEDKRFIPAPCSYYPGRIAQQIVSGLEWNSKTAKLKTTHGYSDIPIDDMIPENDHWIVQKTDNNTNTLHVWYPATNMYEETPLLDGFDGLRAGLDGEWMVASTFDLKTSFLINRINLKILQIPARHIMAISRTPDGNLVLVNLVDHNRYEFILLNTKSEEYSIVTYESKYSEHLRIAGVPDNKIVYAYNDWMDNYRNNLIKIDFSNGSSKIVFPPEKNSDVKP